MNARRIFICRALVAGSILMPLITGAAKLAKADVQYQDRPRDGRDCDDCIQFVPDPTRKTVGSCKVVEGEVSAHGYCLAFTPKPSVK